MRPLLLAALLLALPLAGCTGPANPALRPPCADTEPIRVEIGTDKDRYLPGEIINVTLLLNSTVDQARSLRYRAWEVSLKSFDGRAIRSYFREQDPDLGGAVKSVPPGGRTVLQERWPAFLVTRELLDPLTPGTYYLCAVVTGTDGSTLATGARAFVAERAPQPL